MKIINSNINIIYHKYQWCKELPIEDVSATTLPPTKLEKLELQVLISITSGSRVVVQYVQKRGHGPRAPHEGCDCGKRINGIAQLRPYHYKKLSRRQKTVSRAYGGVLCGGCVKSRIIRAFLLEEIKTIKKAKKAAKKQ
jgi:large subunit ribosomal protein L34e